METVYSQILHRSYKKEKQLAVLIDPDGIDMDYVDNMVMLALKSKIDYFFIGGSLISEDVMDKCIRRIKNQCDIPCVIFPGSYLQICEEADAMLFLSLISGRNPDLLIGQHVIAAPYLKRSNLELIPTGYMNIDGGKPTTASYISNSFPIPRDKPTIAASTAIAGEMLGLGLIFLDAGSGADYPVSSEMITAVKDMVGIPVVVGGGINTLEHLDAAIYAGADVVVVGDSIEKDPEKLSLFSERMYQLQDKQL